MRCSCARGLEHRNERSKLGANRWREEEEEDEGREVEGVKSEVSESSGMRSRLRSLCKDCLKEEMKSGEE